MRLIAADERVCSRRGGAVRSCRTVSPLPPVRRAEAGWQCTSVALSPGSPPPGVTRHRTSVEPGLSSPRATARSGHPTVWHQEIWIVAAPLSKAPRLSEKLGRTTPTISARFDRIGRRATHPDPLRASGARERAVRPLAPPERGEGEARPGDPRSHPARLIDNIAKIWYVAQTFLPINNTTQRALDCRRCPIGDLWHRGSGNCDINAILSPYRAPLHAVPNYWSSW